MRSNNILHMLLSACGVATLAFTLAVSSHAQTESILYSFTGGSDGASPNGGVIADSAGNLYGTTYSGGDLGACGGAGCGVVYKLSPGATGWTQTVLHTFAGPDGANPSAGLVFDKAGNLFGTTSSGGRYTCHGSGCGVIFMLSPTSNGWKEKVIYNFGGGTDGFAPYYGLTMDSSESLYGVAITGGNLVNCASHTYGCGVAFKLWHWPAGWNFDVLYNFTDSDSSSPSSGLILDAEGNLYGAGTGNLRGVVYQLSPAAEKTWKDTTLFTFDGADGYAPGGLIFDTHGNLYGPTYWGGTGGGLVDCEDNQPGCGAVFEITRTSGTSNETVLHNFSGTDANPNGSLIFDAAGNLYGADSTEVFELSRSGGIWGKAALHTFGGVGDGSIPVAPLLFNAAGDIFGATALGGANGNGTVFEITQ